VAGSIPGPAGCTGPGGTNRDLVSEDIGKSPGICALGMDTHRKVLNNPDGHPGFLDVTLGRCELLVDDPLQPSEELHLIAELVSHRLDRGATWVLELRRPLAPRQPVLLGQRAPRGEVEQRLAFALAERGEGTFASR